MVHLYWGWYGAILLLQVLGVASGVWVPWSLGAITRLVSEGLKPEDTQQLLAPLGLFAALIVLEIVFHRGATGCHIRVVPKQRRRVTQVLYAYLQRHSQRFISNQFAGALAHLERILVFANGQVIEDGSHVELLAKRGQYYRLWSRQEVASVLT